MVFPEGGGEFGTRMLRWHCDTVFPNLGYRKFVYNLVNPVFLVHCQRSPSVPFDSHLRFQLFKSLFSVCLLSYYRGSPKSVPHSSVNDSNQDVIYTHKQALNRRHRMQKALSACTEGSMDMLASHLSVEFGI